MYCLDLRNIKFLVLRSLMHHTLPFISSPLPTFSDCIILPIQSITILLKSSYLIEIGQSL